MSEGDGLVVLEDGHGWENGYWFGGHKRTEARRDLFPAGPPDGGGPPRSAYAGLSTACGERDRFASQDALGNQEKGEFSRR